MKILLETDDFNLEDIKCSNKSLSTIIQEINNYISDAFTEISISRQRNDTFEWYDALEVTEGYLCKIQNLLELIK